MQLTGLTIPTRQEAGVIKLQGKKREEDLALCAAGGKDLRMAGSTSMETQMWKKKLLHTFGQCGDIVVLVFQPF